MTEVWNISDLCRCCHAEGEFKSLQLSYTYKKNNEVYANMLAETFGITMSLPSERASNLICDECIAELRAAATFRRQVEECESKFLKFFKDEFQPKGTIPCIPIKKTEIKVEYDEDSSITKIKESGLKEDPDGQTSFNDSFAGHSDDYDDYTPPDSSFANDQFSTLPRNGTKTNKAKRNGAETNKAKTSKDKAVSGAQKNPSATGRARGEHNPLYNCRECGLSNPSLQELIAHLAFHKNTKYTCKICSQEIQGLCHFYRHLSKHPQYENDPFITMIEEKRFVCDICQARFKVKVCLTRHIQRHLGLYKRWICETCGHSFGMQSNLKTHIAVVHDKVRAFPCDICHKKLSTRKSLKAHRMAHFGDKPYPCDHCSKTYSSKLDKSNHVIVEHTDYIKKHDDGSFECPDCSERFTDYKTCTEHVYIHLPKAKPRKRQTYASAQCDICCKVFVSKFCLVRHIQVVHMEVRKRNPCPQCGVLICASALKRHIERKHSGVNKVKVKCEKCKLMVFDLEKHMRSHNIRPFACRYCHRTFPARNALNRHEKDHFSKFTCELCGKVYTLSKSLRTHMKNIHGKVKVESNVPKEGNSSDWL